MYEYNQDTRIVTVTSIPDFSSACRELYEVSTTHLITIKSKELFPDCSGFIQAATAAKYPAIRPLGSFNKYKYNGLIFIEPKDGATPLFYRFEISGVCKLLNGVLIVNPSWLWPLTLTDIIWGVDTDLHTINTPPLTSCTHYLLNILGMSRHIINYVTNINQLPQNPREPIDFEKNIKELFGDKIHSVIMKRMK